MVAQAALPLAAADVMCCLGLGFLLAALYDCGRFLLGSSRVVCFVLDVAAFLLAAVLLCSFAAGRSASGVVRWYMAAGVLCGLGGYFFVLAPASRAVQRFLKWLVSLPLVLLWMLLCKPLLLLQKRLLSAVKQKAKRKRSKCHKKQQQKQLQKQGRILYNSK